jgi:hypothetical protein
MKYIHAHVQMYITKVTIIKSDVKMYKNDESSIIENDMIALRKRFLCCK